jgi:hypothetical protein
LQIPVSKLLARLTAEAPPGRIDLGWFLAKLEQRSFGLLVLVMAIVGLTPGIASLSGFLLTIPSVEMILGRDSPTLPAFLTRRSISTRHFANWIARIVPPLRYAETLAHPRWQMSASATKRLIGVVNLIMALTITLPFPFAYIVPTLVIVLIAFAYLEEDGLLLAAGFVAAFLSFAFSAVQVLAALKAVSFIARF